MNDPFLILGLAAALQTVAPPVPAEAAPDPVEEPADEFADEEEEAEAIVVTGQRERGAVIGDIPPENQLNPREIRSLGASNLSELLDAIAPQTASGRGRGGGRPIVLLNGQRISGFSEIRSLPPEAILRVDILPEEVALRYGYRADQRVVNFVLRPRFRAVTAELEGGLATEGGRPTYEAEANILRVGENGRWNIDVEAEHQARLTESERDLVQAEVGPGGVDLGRFRTLLPATDSFSLGGTINRTILGNVSATANARVEAESREALLGLATLGLDAPELFALTRDSDSRTAHLGVALNGELSRWRWSLTGNFDRTVSESETDRDFQAERDRSRSEVQSADAELVANGTLFALPAGDASATFKLGAQTRGIDARAVRAGAVTETELGRDQANFQASLDLPIASRRRDVLGGIGNLSLNLNAAFDEISDFGTLRTLGAGLNWSPVAEVTLIASVTDEEGAPSIQQLGDPVLLTPGVRVFDFTSGETVFVDRLDGGNPGLLADSRRVYKLGATVKPLRETDFTLRADYTNSRIEDPIASFPAATPAIEAAFPERFVRDAAGQLVQVDVRPVNFAASRREELRWGFTYSRPLGSEPRRPPGGWRQRREGQQREGAGARAGAERPRGRGGFGGGRFGGGRGGRLQLSLFHTWRFTDEILIRPGVPVLDLLGGSAVGERGGRPRHELDLSASASRNGFGGRLSVNWLSGTEVEGGLDRFGNQTGDLRFSDFTSVNLRLFADLGAQRALVREHRWLRGTRVSLNFNNLLNERLGVRDALGETPFGYQPASLDPLGRSVTLSIRKLFF